MRINFEMQSGGINLARLGMLVTWLLMCAFLSSCKQVSCGRYYQFTDDQSSYDQIVEWADRNVFSRSFSVKELRAGSLVGPGRRALPRSIHKGLPIDLADFEVRIVDSDWENPDLIFVGKRRLQGILISRRKINVSLSSAGLPIELMEKTKGRVALMCYQEREIMRQK